MKTQIFIFGASTEWGAWDLEKGGWPARLKLFLFKKENESNDFKVDFHNLSISGNTSSDILKRFKFELEQRIDTDDYDKIVIIFSFGTNDSSYRKSKRGLLIPTKTFEKNLRKLSNEAKKYTKNIYFKGLLRVEESKTSPASWSDDVFYYNKSIRNYDSILKNFCRKNKHHYIKMMNLIEKEDLYDGLHPNSKGHEKIYKRIKNQLIKNKLI
jgi:lysophospholipase L1-like esterase